MFIGGDTVDTEIEIEKIVRTERKSIALQVTDAYLPLTMYLTTGMRFVTAHPNCPIGQLRISVNSYLKFHFLLK